MQGQGGGAPMWSIAVHWVHGLLGLPGGAGQGQPTSSVCLGKPYKSYKPI